METKRVNPKLLMLIAVLAAVVILAGAIWFFATNVIVGGAVYPRSAEFLNLREKELTLQQYDTLRAKLPECEIFWNVPFQGEYYPDDSAELKVTALGEEDLAVVDYFTHLQVVDGRGCKDYAQLTALQEKYPEIAVLYNVSIDGRDYSQNAAALNITAITDEEIALLRYLPALTEVNAEGSTDYGQLAKVKAAYPELALDYTIALCGEAFATDTTELDVTGMTQEETDLLKYFQALTTVHIREPEMPAETLLSLSETYPHITFTWEKTVLGVTIPHDATEVDLLSGISEAGALAFEKAKTATVMDYRDDVVWQFALKTRYPVPDRTADTQDLIRQVEEAMAYFPNAKQVNMNGAFLDNEAMAQFRENHRQDYKVVWTVALGTMAARTDTPYFMPYKYGVAYFFDDYAYNLRYCEDIVCIDMGHMSVHVVDFVEFMPKLKYLVLAHTQIKDITPLSTCKNLVFLELDWSIVRDYTPLQGCTALQDLNLGKTYADVTPLLEMTWLKRLWILDRSPDTQLKLREAFEGTETELYLVGEYTVGGGWRQTENYYAMREILNMKPMN